MAGFGAEIAAAIAGHTDAGVARLGAPRLPVSYAQGPENESRMGAAKIMATAQDLLRS